MPRNICLAFTCFWSLFLLTDSVSADWLFILSRLLAIQQPGNTHGIYQEQAGTISSNEPASSHPPQKPLKPLADSTPNLTPHAADHREIPASTHQPGGDIPRPWSREFRSPPRNEFPVKESSGEPLIGQKPSPLPLPSQSGCGGS